MKKVQVLTAWRQILQGRRPFLAIEVTRECPLRCPGCYAYAPNHAGEAHPLRAISDLTGDALAEGVLAAMRRYRPLHISLIGGEPLIRWRELDILLPRLAPTEVQLVTSAVLPVPQAWAEHRHLHLVVSVDGLPPEHDRRRSPATYERILRNIAGHQVIVHCTITRQLLERRGYLKDFAAFWSTRPEARKIWFSLHTPQTGEISEERLGAADRDFAIRELASLTPHFPKVHMPKLILDGFAQPPKHPGECIFAELTTCISPDLSTEIAPCELGGKPDCTECGCIASAGLAAVGRYRLAGLVPLNSIFCFSKQIGETRRRWRRENEEQSLKASYLNRAE